MYSSTQSFSLFFLIVLNFRKGAIIAIGALLKQNRSSGGGGRDLLKRGSCWKECAKSNQCDIQCENFFSVEIVLFRMEWTPVYFFLVDLVRASVFISTQTLGMESFSDENDGFFIHLRKHHQEVRCLVPNRPRGAEHYGE